MKGYIIETNSGTEPVALTKDNMLIKDEFDMDNIEFWEERLQALKQSYVLAYRKRKGKIAYTIFTKMRGKGSAFKFHVWDEE